MMFVHYIWDSKSQWPNFLDGNSTKSAGLRQFIRVIFSTFYIEKKNQDKSKCGFFLGARAKRMHSGISALLNVRTPLPQMWQN